MAFRAALIGCGRIGSAMADDPLMAGDVFTHAEAYVRSPATELAAVCDADGETARRCAARWGVAAAFTDPAEMMAAVRPEIVSVATPDATHFAVARAAIESGHPPRALLCEKPLAGTSDEAEALIGLARRRSVVLAVVHMRRHARNIRELRRYLADGRLGRVRAVSGWYGKGVLHNGVHWFDQLRMLAGEVAWVEARDTLGEGGPDPTLDVDLGLEGGGVATLRAVAADSFTVFEADLVADRGRVRILDSGYRIELYRAAPSPRYANYVELAPVPHAFGDRRDVMLHAVEDLAAALREGRAPACTGEDGLAALRIGEAALKAARSGLRVRPVAGLPMAGS